MINYPTKALGGAHSIYKLAGDNDLGVTIDIFKKIEKPYPHQLKDRPMLNSTKNRPTT